MLICCCNPAVSYFCPWEIRLLSFRAFASHTGFNWRIHSSCLCLASSSGSSLSCKEVTVSLTSMDAQFQFPFLGVFLISAVYPLPLRHDPTGHYRQSLSLLLYPLQTDSSNMLKVSSWSISVGGLSSSNTDSSSACSASRLCVSYTITASTLLVSSSFSSSLSTLLCSLP